MTGQQVKEPVWKDEQVVQLLRLLQQLQNLYQNVLKACETNRDGLIENDTPKMEQALQTLTVLLQEVQKLEEQRLQVLQDMAAAAELDANGLTVSTLLRYLPDPLAARLSTVSEGLKQSLERIAEINSLNEELVGQSIAFFQKTLDVVSSVVNGPTYGSKKPHNRVTGRLFDSRG